MRRKVLTTKVNSQTWHAISIIHRKYHIDSTYGIHVALVIGIPQSYVCNINMDAVRFCYLRNC